MNAVATLNAAGLLAAMATSAALTGLLGVRVADDTSAAVAQETQTTVSDADGHEIPVRPYRRIVSATTIADQVLIELVEPSRVVAVTTYTLTHGARSWRYQGKLGIENARDVETILRLRPDIVFVNAFADVRHVERMREAGLVVFNLGDLRGLQTLLVNIEQIASVVGVRSRGESLAEDFTRRLGNVAADVEEEERERALYAGMYGGRLYGGTTGSSIHDVLTAAGLIDVAAEAGLSGSPGYTREEILVLDPPWIITNEGGEARLCEFFGLESLSACTEGQVRGVSDALMGDPGLRMLRAAEAVHQAVYGAQ
jgi:iron complex transport system substrate-binding protein